MRYAEYPPALRHAAIVERYWFLEGDGIGVPDAVVPDGRVEFIFHTGVRFCRHQPNGVCELQPRTILAGQMLTPIVLSHTGFASVAAIRLRPSAVKAVIGCNASEVTSRVLDLVDVLPGAHSVIEQLAEAGDDRTRMSILEAWLVSIVHLRPRRDVDHAVEGILGSAGGGQLATIASQAGISLRQLERRFADEVGLPPKTFARIVRLQRALRQIRDGLALGEAALACGYFDQAHMTRDFSRLAEMSPHAWRERTGQLAALFVG
jgi:AraC-like DNA-binding protein